MIKPTLGFAVASNLYRVLMDLKSRSGVTEEYINAKLKELAMSREDNQR